VERTPDRRIGFAGTGPGKARQECATESTVFWPCVERKCWPVGAHGDERAMDGTTLRDAPRTQGTKFWKGMIKLTRNADSGIFALELRPAEEFEVCTKI